MSARSLGPNTLSRILAMFVSSKGWGMPWQKSRIAFAIYCPIPGSASTCSRSLGNRPLRLYISCERAWIDVALRFQRPTGCKSSWRSLMLARLNAAHDGYFSMNPGKKFAMTSALVRCNRTSAMITRYKLAEDLRHGNFRPFLKYQESRFSLKVVISSELVTCSC